MSAADEAAHPPLRFLITAGPTREPVDSVRFLSNRSSGRMGYALAGAAIARGHEVTLVTGPVALKPPAGCRVVAVETAAQMHRAVAEICAGPDALAPAVAVLAAAVADYRPRVCPDHKIKKSDDGLTLELERTEDILADMRGRFGFRGLLVGFAAETRDLVANAQDKLRRKGCDLVVANPVGPAADGTGFDSGENQITVCFRNGAVEEWGRADKVDLAFRLVELFERRVRNFASDDNKC